MSRYETDEYRERHAEYSRTHRARNKEQNRERMKRWQNKNKGKWLRIRKNADLWKNYGITIGLRDLLFRQQGYKCAICGSMESGRKGADFAVDHCHLTDQIRGILCHPCNAMLGYAKDNLETLRAAIKYIERFHELERDAVMRRVSWERE